MTMWIPTPSMTVPQRMVLYGTCALALVNSVGLLVLLAQQNQQRSWLEQTGARLTEVEQSSVVEFLQEVPRGPAGIQARPAQYQYQYQYSRNKRSDTLEKEASLEHRLGEEEEEVMQRGVSEQEVSQEVGEETEKKRRDWKHKNKAHVQDDMMMMMTYSMVPVREREQILMRSDVVIADRSS